MLKKIFLAVDNSGKVIKAEVTNPKKVVEEYCRNNQIIEVPRPMTKNDIDNFIKKLID